MYNSIELPLVSKNHRAPHSCEVIEAKYNVELWEWTQLYSPLLDQCMRIALQLNVCLLFAMLLYELTYKQDLIAPNVKRKRPIFFLSYGFGGFVVLQVCIVISFLLCLMSLQIIMILKHSGKKFEDFFQNIASVIAFSCPHYIELSTHLRGMLCI